MQEGFLGEESSGEKYMGKKYVQEEFLGEEFLGEKYVQEEFLGQEPLGEKYMGEKYVQEEFLGEEFLGEKYMGEKSVGEKSLGKIGLDGMLSFVPPFSGVILHWQEISRSIGTMPFPFLHEKFAKVRIPMPAFQDLENDYCPLLFFLSPASAKHGHWLSVRPTDGLLIGKVEDAGEDETRQLIVEVLYPEAKKGSVQFTVKDAPPHWEHRTNKVIARVNELRVPNCPLWENFRAILEQPLNDLRRPKGNQFGKWLQSMETLLRMLRSLPSANLVKDSANTGDKKNTRWRTG